MASVLGEILCHKNQIVVAASLLQSVPLHAVFQEAQSRVKTPRLFIVHHHAELDQFDLPTGMIAYRFDQPSADPGIPCGGLNVHSPKLAFVSLLLALLDSKADNADEPERTVAHGGGSQVLRDVVVRAVRRT